MSIHINKVSQVAVWGSYLWGNFGDDVMAIMISRHLQKQGFHPVVYKLDPKLAKHYGISSESDLDTLLSSSVACIIGGGGFLCSSSGVHLMDSEYKHFYLSLLNHSIPVHFCSIGGDGSSSLPLLSLYLTKLFLLPNVKSGTVRLETDLKIFQEIGIHSEFYPDIILSSPMFFPLEHKTNDENNSKKKRKLSIIMNFGKSNKMDILGKLISLIFPLLSIRVTYLRTHLSWLNPSNPPFLDYEYLGSESNEQNVIYENVEQVRDALINCDLIISSKLHVGVFALSYGVPFMSINGAKKTQSFLDQAEIKSSYLNTRGFSLSVIWRIFLLLLNRKKILFMTDAIKNNSKLKSLIEQSFGHFYSIDRFLSEHSILTGGLKTDH
ncbi:polysaccharide pyruvyl transferase family protein [Anabaenopsis sp. FSS-46]|uniref:polysaccharide pyruvyl transferase family protein n=1 Tax=Anabaenopsis sp. FSS-46 TaxID=2971766 RepID=UPI002475AF1A|nr:polysaccharide pyruvyl transferase family protein [Anabaenopsis sp. FSS-46]MDH6099439.1 polysaccharide pyruvyl transferase family protein [Anabaenopsis sp. FSS-46]